MFCGWLLRWFSETGRYVVPADIPIKHPEHGDDVVPAGFRFDGASGVANLSMAECAKHDWLYFTGQVNGKPVTRSWTDNEYCKGLAAAGHKGFAKIRRAFFKIWPFAWRKHRRNDPPDIASRMVDNPDAWIFPTWEIRDAYRKP